MAGGINVTTEVLVNTAQTIDNINESMGTKLESIKTKMNNLENTWDSQASRDIRAAMNALQPRFDEYRDVVADYAKFLRKTAESYNITEETAVKDVNSVQFK